MGVTTVTYANGMIEFSAQGCSTPTTNQYSHCFAGQNDELVVSASKDHNLYIWSLPSDWQEVDRKINQPLAVLRGHKEEIYCVRYNRRSDTLASAGVGKIIKLWTPRQDW